MMNHAILCQASGDVKTRRSRRERRDIIQSHVALLHVGASVEPI